MANLAAAAAAAAAAANRDPAVDRSLRSVFGESFFSLFLWFVKAMLYILLSS